MKTITKIAGICLLFLMTVLNASAQDDMFFKGLKNAYKLNPKSIPETSYGSKDVLIPYTQLKDRYTKITIINGAGEDFWICLQPKGKEFYIPCSMSIFSDMGNDPEAEEPKNTHYENEYIIGFYDFDNDGVDEIVVAGRSVNSKFNDLAIHVIFPNRYKGGLDISGVDDSVHLIDDNDGQLTAELKDGIISVKTSNPDNAPYYSKFKWNSEDKEFQGVEDEQ